MPMPPDMMREAIPMEAQQRFWNEWNAAARERQLESVCTDQADVITGWLRGSGRHDLDILDAGCGTGWLCERLSPFGAVTGTDLSHEVLDRARMRLPDVRFVAGDFMTLDFGGNAFDVVTTVEVLSHVADQPAFIAKLAYHLRPGGHLMLATQNRPVLERYNRIAPPKPGQLRRWVDKNELKRLLSKKFEIVEIFSITPKANKGLMRIINSRTFNRPVHALVGRRLDRLKEAAGLGWTLMALARKRP
ncbi:MAG: methyltransferase domain-containing protein [Hyphomicrobiales bacterium]|nr:methyltransferase domain-containing protein [Hyphomicrobiales bacterium]